jgi:diguanylate cyclase (GGDEF)-like protein
MGIKQLNNMFIIIASFVATLFFFIFGLYSNYKIENNIINSIKKTSTVIKIETVEYLKQELKSSNDINYILRKNRTLNKHIMNIDLIKDNHILFSSDIDRKLKEINLKEAIYLNTLTSESLHNKSGVKVNIYLPAEHYILYLEFDKDSNSNILFINMVENVLIPLGFFILIALIYHFFVRFYLEAPVLSINEYIENNYKNLPKFYIKEFNTIAQTVEVNFKKLFNLAYKDNMTQLENRNFIEDKINSRLIHKKPFYLIMINVENFRRVNELFGFLEGDRVIKVIANILRSSTDSFTISRISGADFAILYDIDDKNSLIKEIENILARFRNPIQISEQNYIVKLKMGISYYPTDGSGIDDLFRNSEIALNHIKSITDKSFMFFDKSLLDEIENRELLKQSFKRALKNEEFELYYQPKIDLKTKKPISVETLIRWNHPTKGFLYPDEFIPKLTNCCLKQLEEWVIKSAVKQQLYWKNILMFDISVSVNIEPRHILIPDFFTSVVDIIETSDIEKDKIIFEVSESSIAHEIDEVNEIIKKFKALDINFCLDNFKTGTTSIEDLENLSIDSFKIDRTFMKYIDTEQDSSILQAFILMAQFMKKEIVAVGVEDWYQVEFLQHKGIAVAQGNYFSKPLNVADFEKYMNDKIFA